PYRLLSHWQPETEPDKQVRHESRRQLDLVAHAAARCEDARLVFKTRDRDRRSLRGKLRARGLRPEAGWMVAHCGASAPSRRYPAGQFAQALKLLNGRAGTVLLTGDAGERKLTREVAE